MNQNSYVRKTKEDLVEKLKSLTTQCLNIVGQVIDEDLKDDKLLNALKAKDHAAEMSLKYAEEVEKLEGELRGEIAKKKEKVSKNIAETMAN